MPLGPRFAYAARRRRLPRAVIVPHLHSVAFIATTLERMMRQGTSGTTDRLLVTSAEAVVHDFFRDHPNYFRDLEVAAEALRGTEANEPDDIYATLKARLLNTHGIRFKRRTIEGMSRYCASMTSVLRTKLPRGFRWRNRRQEQRNSRQSKADRSP
jgi:hypothetical protein